MATSRFVPQRDASDRERTSPEQNAPESLTGRVISGEPPICGGVDLNAPQDRVCDRVVAMITGRQRLVLAWIICARMSQDPQTAPEELSNPVTTRRQQRHNG